MNAVVKQFECDLLSNDKGVTIMFELNSTLSIELTSLEHALSLIMTDFALIPEIASDLFYTSLTKELVTANPHLTEHQIAAFIVKHTGALKAFSVMEFNIKALLSASTEASNSRVLAVVIGNHLRNWLACYTKMNYPR